MSLKYNLLKDPKETKTIFVLCFSESLNSKSFDKSYTKMSEYVKHIVIGRSETKSD